MLGTGLKLERDLGLEFAEDTDRIRGIVCHNQVEFTIAIEISSRHKVRIYASWVIDFIAYSAIHNSDLEWWLLEALGSNFSTC